MLWLIGFVVVLIDVFYRLSVPVDTVIQYHHHHKDTTTSASQHHDKLTLIDSSILDGPRINELFDKLGIKNLDQAMKFLSSFPGGIRHESSVMSERQSQSVQGFGSKAEIPIPIPIIIPHLAKTVLKSTTSPGDEKATTNKPHHPLAKSKGSRNERKPDESESEAGYHGRAEQPRGADGSNADKSRSQASNVDRQNKDYEANDRNDNSNRAPASQIHTGNNDEAPANDDKDKSQESQSHKASETRHDSGNKAPSQFSESNSNQAPAAQSEDHRGTSSGTDKH